MFNCVQGLTNVNYSTGRKHTVNRDKPEMNGKRVYVAASYHNRFLMQVVASILMSRGLFVTSRWISETPTEINQERASTDFQDIDDSDFVLCFYPMSDTNNMSSEMAYAYAKGKIVIYVREQGEGLGFEARDPLIVGRFQNVSDYYKHIEKEGFYNFCDKGFIVGSLQELDMIITRMEKHVVLS